jgi:hypothetical protein
MVHALTETAQAVNQERERSGEDEIRAANGRLAWLLAEARGSREDPYRYVLVLRFTVVNLVAFGLLGAAHVQGLTALVLNSDRTGLSAAIFGVFVIGLTICGVRVFQTSRDLNHVRDFDPLAESRAAKYLARLRGRSAESRSTHAANLRLKLSNRIAIVRHVANSLILLGLIGTVIGFIIALSGVDPRHVAEVEAVGPMVATLIEGMSVALYTTLVGAVLNLWLMINHNMLTTGTVKLLTALIEFGEDHARA